MMRRLLCMLLCLCLILPVLPARAVDAMEQIDLKDTVTGSYFVTEADTGNRVLLDYQVPEGGAAVLIFFSAGCGNCANLFRQLDQASWVDDPAIRFYAVESNFCTPEAARDFRDRVAPNLPENFFFFSADDMMPVSDYMHFCNFGLMITWPMVLICTEQDGVKMVRYADLMVTDPNVLQTSIIAALESDASPGDQPDDTLPGDVELMVSGRVSYDDVWEVADDINDFRREQGLPEVTVNSTLTELAMEWAAGIPLQLGNDQADGTTIREFVSSRFPEGRSYNCWQADEGLWAMEVAGRLSADTPRGNGIYNSAMTQVGIGAFFVGDYCFWTVFFATDGASHGQLERTGWEYRRYTAPNNADNLPEIMLQRFPIQLDLNQTAITELMASHCAYEISARIDPAVLTEQIYDVNTGALIATAGIWADGMITVTGVAPGHGYLEVFPYPGLDLSVRHEIMVVDRVHTKNYNITTQIQGNGAVELSAVQSHGNKKVSFRVTPDHRYALSQLSVRDAYGNETLYHQPFGDEYVFRMPEWDVEIYAEFCYITHYPITVTSNMPEFLRDTGSDLEPGDQYGIHVQPPAGWKLAGVTWDGEPAQWQWVDDGNAISLIMPEWPVNLHLEYAGDEDATEGHFGDGMYWWFDGIGLSISGEGPLNTLIDGPTGPWAHHLDKIEILHIDSDFTSICDGAVSNFPNLEIVTIAATVTEIGAGIFTNCPNLMDIILEGDPKIHPDAFTGVPGWGHEHDFQMVVTKPTCTEEGNRRLVCACGEQALVEELPALGHDWAGNTCRRCGAVSGSPFSDVKTTDYFYDSVTWAVEQGITSGTGGNSFSPNQTCTRAQVVTFLWRAMGKPTPRSNGNPFADVPQGSYYYDAVLWAVEQGITSGTGTGTFSPDKPCTRDQVVTFLWRAMGKPAPNAQTTSFTDVPTNAYYFEPVLWAVENKITSGTSATTFSPSVPCTRGQVVTFLYRAMK